MPENCKSLTFHQKEKRSLIKPQIGLLNRWLMRRRQTPSTSSPQQSKISLWHFDIFNNYHLIVVYKRIGLSFNIKSYSLGFILTEPPHWLCPGCGKESKWFYIFLAHFYICLLSSCPDNTPVLVGYEEREVLNLAQASQEPYLPCWGHLDLLYFNFDVWCLLGII